jgi:hypothetical protein
MKRLTTTLAVLFTLLLPFGALAMEQQGGKMEGMGQDSGAMQGMKGMDQGGMMNGMMMLGDQTENGVKAMAHIKDIHEGMAKMGMDQTHHLMVMFTDTASGKPIATGTVAVKIKDPAGKVSKPIQLMPMNMGEGDAFGSDIALPAKGKYQFLIGSKLEDGKKRQFKFDFDNK